MHKVRKNFWLLLSLSKLSEEKTGDIFIVLMFINSISDCFSDQQCSQKFLVKIDSNISN